jgi:hypothetical protein
LDQEAINEEVWREEILARATIAGLSTLDFIQLSLASLAEAFPSAEGLEVSRPLHGSLLRLPILTKYAPPECLALTGEGFLWLADPAAEAADQRNTSFRMISTVRICMD